MFNVFYCRKIEAKKGRKKRPLDALRMRRDLSNEGLSSAVLLWVTSICLVILSISTSIGAGTFTFILFFFITITSSHTNDNSIKTSPQKKSKK